MASWISRSAIVGLACSILGASAAAVERRSSNYQLSVYYGQNSANQWDSQKPLTGYCSDTNIKMMPIGFVTAFNGPGGVPVTNFANACTGPSFTVNGVSTGLLNCQANIGQAMNACKSQYGTKFLISLGGATYNEGGWATPQQAQAAAKQIFDIFGPKNPSVTYRPFGDICIDGFDLDFEMNTRNLDVFALQLRQLIDSQGNGMMLTAAPQCPFPDANVGKALDATIFDAVFIQFYNNYCSTSTYNINIPMASQSTFNLQSWQNWANGKRTKLFIGFVADPGTYGYTSPDNAAAIIRNAMQFANFGGAMVWDMSLAMYKNPGFLDPIKISLSAGPSQAKQIAPPAAPKPAPKPAPAPAPKPAPAPAKPAPAPAKPAPAPAKPAPAPAKPAPAPAKPAPPIGKPVIIIPGSPVAPKPKSAPVAPQQKSTSSTAQGQNNTHQNSNSGTFKVRRRHAHHHRRGYLAPVSA